MAVVNANRFNFAEVVQTALNQYVHDGVIPAMQEAVKEVAKESAKKLRATSPKGKSGDYAKNWKSKIENGRITVQATVYGDKPTYSLAHLLEHGHATRNGGRTGAIEHIKPVEEWAIKEAEERFYDKLERYSG